jgi:hypothetical protein
MILKLRHSGGYGGGDLRKLSCGIIMEIVSVIFMEDDIYYGK